MTDRSTTYLDFQNMRLEATAVGSPLGEMIYMARTKATISTQTFKYIWKIQYGPMEQELNIKLSKRTHKAIEHSRRNYTTVRNYCLNYE